MEHHTFVTTSLTKTFAVWDIGRWAVRLGRHPLEKESRGPKV
jgi:hypothetical protein